MKNTHWTYVKLALVQVIALSTLMMLVACGDKKSDTIAQTPQSSCNVPGQTNCNPGMYGEAGWGYPSSNYPWQSAPNGFCGCTSGYPSYGSSYGLGCVPQNLSAWNPMNGYYNGNPYVGYSWQNFYSSYAAPYMNYQHNNIPQHYYSGSTSGVGTCYQQAYMACNPDTANSCGSSATCLRSGPASAVGLCVRNDFMQAYRYRYNAYPPYIGYTY